jgi:transcription initiation factor TFIIIB Brf1 subunit/transcription initiation factor TFIIB
MNWRDLKYNKCPQCGKDFTKGLNTTRNKMMIHSCGFVIGESKYTKIVNAMVEDDLENNSVDNQDE